MEIHFEDCTDSVGTSVCNLRDRGLRYEHVFFGVLFIGASFQQAAKWTFLAPIVVWQSLANESPILQC